MATASKRSILTRKNVIAICKELWTWMADTGSNFKEDWPGWKKYNDMLHNCPFCQYANQQGQHNPYNRYCPACPYWKKFGYCEDNGKPYALWFDVMLDGTESKRKEHARAFLTQLEEL